MVLFFKKILSHLYLQVIIAVIIGILLGYFFPHLAIEMKPFGDGFLKLIKMIIAPVIFCTIVLGIAGMENTKSVGKTGGIAIVYFEILSTFALIIGLVVVNLVKPGKGMNVDLKSLDKTILPHAQSSSKGFVEFILNIIPESVVSAFAHNNILQVLLFALFFGFALQKLGQKSKLVYDFIDQLAKIIYIIIDFIMKLAPLGAFGAIAYTIGAFGIATLAQLASLMICFYLTCIIFIVLILGSVAKFSGFNIFRLLRYIKDEIFIVLGTSSSEAALPKMLIKLEKLGCHKSTVGLVLPTGYSFNLDGTSIYLTMAAVFLAQATNHDMDIWNQLLMLAFLLFSSKGAAAVSGGAFIILVATIEAAGHIPVEAVVIIFGINRFMSEMVSLTNMIGNGVATIFISKLVNTLDEEKLNSELNS